MKSMHHPFARLAALLGLTLGLAACGGAKDQYFRLSAEGATPVGSSGVAVGVGPVSLPAYIDRGELVFMSGANEVQIPSKVHWAGTLNDNFTRTLATDLAHRIGSSNVVPYPWGANARLSYQVVVDVRQFHAISGGEAVLDASWRIQSPEGGQVLRRDSVSLRERIVGDGYEPVVTAESRLVEQLANSISRALPGRR